MINYASFHHATMLLKFFLYKFTRSENNKSYYNIIKSTYSKKLFERNLLWSDILKFFSNKIKKMLYVKLILNFSCYFKILFERNLLLQYIF